jgi:hypothetical protein
MNIQELYYARLYLVEKILDEMSPSAKHRYTEMLLKVEESIELAILYVSKN